MSTQPDRYNRAFTNHADWLKAANKYADCVCARHPEWDRDDLVGAILLVACKMNPTTYGEFGNCCKWGTSTWFRSRLGVKGQKAMIHSAMPFSYLEQRAEESGASGENLGLGYEHDFTDQSDGEIDFETRTDALNDRDQQILAMRMAGYTMREIGGVLDITTQRVSELWSGRIRRVLHRQSETTSVA